MNRQYCLIVVIIGLGVLWWLAQADTRAPLDDVISQVQNEVAYCEYVLTADNESYSHEHLLAVSALNRAQAYVSAPLYGYLMSQENATGIDSTADILNTGAGICGHAAAFHKDIMTRLGVGNRYVRFYLPDGSTHIANEVWYSGEWHYYDPTWGTYFKKDGRVLPMAEVLQLAEADEYAIQNASLFWYRVEKKIWALDILAMLKRPGLRAEYGN